MKKLIQQVIRMKNPNFSFDSSLQNRVIAQLVFIKFMSYVRGLKVCFFLKKPNQLFLGRNVRFFAISKVKWGKFVQLGNHVYVSGMGSEGLTFGSHVSIGDFSRIVVSTSFHEMGTKITIGNYVGIGEFAYLGGAGGLEIGDECIIGQYFSCHPENHTYSHPEIPIRKQGVNRQGIKIGKNCWIGSKVTLLDGVEIGDGCVIAAGSVVNHSFPANSVIGGVPAKFIKARC